ncbi:MAG: hypothetical protein DHS20C19_09000 [Acidimicrobiales bacterium]|nr:MAG: hypothetical protein DHS20C19_09000 [Acidimicrobiales bacterium]
MLLGDTDTFFSEYWEENYLHRRGRIDPIPARFDDVDRLLHDHVLSTSTVALSANGSLLDAERYTVDPTTLITGGDGPQTVVDPDRLLAEFQHGANVVFHRVEDYLPAAAAVASELESIVGQPLRGNMFLTPPGSPGLPPHVDGADVFVFQCEGVKRWELWRRVIPRPLCEDEFNRRELTEPEVVIDLEPGDLLYLPRGWDHRVGAAAESSLSISLNIRTVTHAHLARAALDVALQSEDFRRAVSPEAMCDPAVLAAEAKQVIDELSRAIAGVDAADITGVVDELVGAVKRPKPSITLQQAIDAIGLTDNHRLRLGDGVVIDGTDLRRGDAVVTPPAAFIAGLGVTGRDPTTVGQLRGALPLAAAEPLLLRLLDDGWVTAT